MTGAARIGISGWRYGPWRGTFYPEDLPQARELAHASRQLDTIEINGSFYSLQTPQSYGAWRDATPPGFVFAVKGGRFITHIKRLRDCTAPLANFFASGVLALQDKLGPVLWQLPPFFRFDAKVIGDFLAQLPRTTSEAAQLGKRHDARLNKDRAYLEVDAERPLRHTMEVRHDSFIDPSFVKLLRKYNVAMCVADNARNWPVLEDVTADFVYCRLHGHTQMYASGYSAPALDRWAERVEAWRQGEQAPGAELAAPELAPKKRTARDVYVYFDNDAKIRAPYDAINLAARLHGRPRVPFPRAFRDRGEEPRNDPRFWRRGGPAQKPMLGRSTKSRSSSSSRSEPV
ncbi:MAG TPA: DUF72 domain-containing protein [Verrucomicrobiae bacterium]|nr:DUF72 domain-containing protein [Verrucomicrobiae bacterium]